MKAISRGFGLVLLPAVALVAFGGGGRGAVGAPAGAMNVVNDYPRGFHETNEHEGSLSNGR